MEELDVGGAGVLRVDHLLFVVVLDYFLDHTEASFEVDLLLLFAEFPEDMDEVEEVVFHVHEGGFDEFVEGLEGFDLYLLGVLVLETEEVDGEDGFPGLFELRGVVGGEGGDAAEDKLLDPLELAVGEYCFVENEVVFLEYNGLFLFHQFQDELFEEVHPK